MRSELNRGLAPAEEKRLLESALQATRDTRLFAAEPGIRHRSASLFASLFGSREAVVVADENTFRAAGRDVQRSFAGGNHATREPFVFGPHVYPDWECVLELEGALRAHQAVPVAVGSGTINDLTKLVSHRLNRPYIVVATAASMDGYASFGASITKDDSKQSMDCPGPRAVLADPEVIALAPEGMNASGYADLLAKVVAGADWILAEVVGAEPIHAPSWNMVQGLLRSWVASPEGVARNDAACVHHLLTGLVMSGFAMQTALSSRPAAGAEHQFSHLWDMQHHTHNGVAPSHGFKVGIGTLASLALYEDLLRRDLENLDVETAVRGWPSFEGHAAAIFALLGEGGVAERALQESRAKYVSQAELRTQLTRLRANWPAVREDLVAQLIPFPEMREMLRAAGCPFDPAHIGISRERLRLAYRQCCYLRRRFTVLDLAQRAGVLEPALENVFGPDGPFSAKGAALA
jgi:glycerol-1-phosphate dehydrogenase [NAD(P)+]